MLPLPLPSNVEDASELLASIERSTERRLAHILQVEAGGDTAIAIELAICEEDPEYWLEWYCWTYDPRNPLETPALPSNLPFDLCPKQLELWRWIDYILTQRQDGCVKKSRGIGFTWIAAAKAWHKWRFSQALRRRSHPARRLRLTRSATRTASSKRCGLLYRALPKWMLPIGFNPNIHDKQMLLINPENDNTVRGEGGDEIGRGGRSTLIIVDEAAVLEHADRVEAATSANADVRIWG
jgi:phage terminase large subunit